MENEERRRAVIGVIAMFGISIAVLALIFWLVTSVSDEYIGGVTIGTPVIED